MNDRDLPIVTISLCTHANEIEKEQIISSAKSIEGIKSEQTFGNKKSHIQEGEIEDTEVVHSSRGFDLPGPLQYDILKLESEEESSLHVHSVASPDVFEEILTYHQQSLMKFESVKITNITSFIEYEGFDGSDMKNQVWEDPNVASILYRFESERLTVTKREDTLRFTHEESIDSVAPADLASIAESHLDKTEERISEVRE